MRVGFFISVAILIGASVTRAAPVPARPPGQAQPPAPAVTPAPAQAGAATGEPLPTMEELNAQLAAGKLQDVLKHVAKLLQLKGDAAKSYDRYDLLCLRGEAALRAKTNSVAMDAFNQAARATEDKDKQAVAKATE